MILFLAIWGIKSRHVDSKVSLVCMMILYSLSAVALFFCIPLILVFMQDTLYLHYGKQYLRDCYIEGSVDFIFGNSTALLEHCHIHCKSNGYITAQSRKSSQETTGYVFLRFVCNWILASLSQIFLPDYRWVLEVNLPWRVHRCMKDQFFWFITVETCLEIVLSFN